MALQHDIARGLAWLSNKLGLETVDRFPAGSPWPHTRWNRAYFDIPSDLKADAIERVMCAAIENTPTVFAHITHPTPRMQRALLNVIEARMRRTSGEPSELTRLLVQAYESRYTPELAPGVRAVLQDSIDEAPAERARLLLQHLTL